MALAPLSQNPLFWKWFKADFEKEDFNSEEAESVSGAVVNKYGEAVETIDEIKNSAATAINDFFDGIMLKVGIVLAIIFVLFLIMIYVKEG